MITIIENECLFCKSYCDPDDDKRIGDLMISSHQVAAFHKMCWAEYTCGRVERLFDSFEEWRLYAGDEWDMTDRIEVSDYGAKFWCRKHSFHREDGPAMEFTDGTMMWWLDSKKYTEQAYRSEIAVRIAKGDIRPSWLMRHNLNSSLTSGL